MAFSIACQTFSKSLGTEAHKRRQDLEPHRARLTPWQGNVTQPALRKHVPLQAELCFSMSGVSQSTCWALTCASVQRAVSVTLQKLCFSLSVFRQLSSFHGSLTFFKITLSTAHMASKIVLNMVFSQLDSILNIPEERRKVKRTSKSKTKNSNEVYFLNLLLKNLKPHIS